MQNEQYPERQGDRSLTFAAQQNQADRTEPRTQESGFRRNHTHRNFGRTPLAGVILALGSGWLTAEVLDSPASGFTVKSTIPIQFTRLKNYLEHGDPVPKADPPRR